MKNKTNEILTVHFDYTPNKKVQVQVDCHDIEQTHLYDVPVDIKDEEEMSDLFNYIGDVLWDAVNNSEPVG